MGLIRCLGAVTAVKGTPTPAVLAAAKYPSAGVLAVASFSITKNIATVVLTPALPTNGYNGPDNTIQGNFPAPNGQQVTLWGFGTGTYFNGKKISVISNNPSAKSFSFYFTHADVSSTADTTGLVATSPFEHYRVIRLECGQGLSTDLIYVGDLNVSSTCYMAALSLAGQLAIEIASENIPPEGLFIDTSGTSGGDTCQVTVIY